MTEPDLRPGVRDVRDAYGRRYSIGVSDRAVLGCSRRWVAAAGWLAMLAVSSTQYGYGVLAPVLTRSHGWGSQPVLWGFTLWIACHAAATGALAWLRGRTRLAPSRVVTAGAVGCAIGLLALGNVGGAAVALTMYGVACGTGAGLVYGTCLATVAGWYPDRPGRTAAVSGAFAYGAIPLVLITARLRGLALPLDETAFAVLTLVAGCALILKDAPPDWWPADLDPRRWALDKSLNPSVRHDPPAIRRYPTREVLRCPATRVMTAAVVCVCAVALFDTAYLALFGVARGWPLPDAAVALAAFAAGSGAVRAPAVRAAARWGRTGVLRTALCAGAAAQLGLLTAGTHHAPVPFVVAACCAGGGTGAWYALFPGLVRSHFGDHPGLPNLWLLYSAKAVGGLLGIGCAGLLLARYGYPPVLTLTCALCLAAAGLIRLLRRPGMPRTLPGMPLARPRHPREADAVALWDG